MSEPGLGLRELAVAVASVRLLEGLSLAVGRGELVGLSGRSGLGKSTLLRVVSGLIDAASGHITLDGRTPDELGWPAYRRRVVHVAQRPVLLDLTVRASLARAFGYASAGRAWPAQESDALLERLGLSDRAEQDARSLSLGQQQRVALARALLVEPAFVLLDEPTSALDPESAEVVEALVRDAVDAGGLGGLVVSHDRAQLERWCGRVIELGDFAVGEGSP